MQGHWRLFFGVVLPLVLQLKVSCGQTTPVLLSDPVSVSTEFNFIRCLKPDVYRPGIILVCAASAVMEFNITSGEYSTIAGTYSSSPVRNRLTDDGEDGPATFIYVSDLVQRDQDTLIVSDLQDHCLQWVKSGNTSLLTGNCGNKGNQDGTFVSARFERPSNIILNENNMYVLNGLRLAIRLVNFLTGKVSTLITNENMSNPFGMACITPHCNNIYAAFTNGVMTYNQTTNTTHLLAGRFEARGDSTGSFENTQFFIPTSLLFLRNYTLLVADTVNHRIVVLNLNESIRSSQVVERTLTSPRSMLCYDGSLYIGIEIGGIYKSDIVNATSDLICHYPQTSSLTTPTTIQTITPTIPPASAPIGTPSAALTSQVMMNSSTPSAPNTTSSSSLCSIHYSILGFLVAISFFM